MTAPIRTVEEAIAWETARTGLSRLDARNDWAAGRSIDDCALFQSMAVFGQRVAWNVDVLKRYGTYTPGKAGLRRGDLVLFDWEGNGVGNHVEMALESPNAAGAFLTIGANRDSTYQVKTGTRNGYVMGHVRPAYPAPAPASVIHQPLSEEIEMKTAQAHYTDAKGNVIRCLFTPGTGYFLMWTEGGSSIANGFAKTLDTGNSTPVTESMFNAIKGAADRLAK